MPLQINVNYCTVDNHSLKVPCELPLDQNNENKSSLLHREVVLEHGFRQPSSPMISRNVHRRGNVFHYLGVFLKVLATGD